MQARHDEVNILLSQQITLAGSLQNRAVAMEAKMLQGLAREQELADQVRLRP